MRVLADLHHFDLYHSFQLLFEKRLGWELYRPIGYEWANEGFWNLCGKEYPPIEGYLSTEDGQCARTLLPYWEHRSPLWARFATELVRVGKILPVDDGLYLIEDKSKGVFQKGITLERFKEERFDIIISSIPQHFESTERLRKLYQPQAKHIVHVGSIVGCPVPLEAKNIMAHAPPISNAHYVVYSQEFSLDTFKYSIPINSNRIRSYVHFPESQDLWEKMDLDWDFKFVGKTLASLGETIISSEDLSKCIQNSNFTWHIKLGGESYGHILHNSYACGRPVIINGDDYVGSRGGLLLEDMVTSIDVTGRTPEELKNKLVYAQREDVYMKMCERAYSRFHEIVNFDEEFESIKSFLQDLQ